MVQVTYLLTNLAPNLQQPGHGAVSQVASIEKIPQLISGKVHAWAT
jgi:hypothetical protein